MDMSVKIVCVGGLCEQVHVYGNTECMFAWLLTVCVYAQASGVHVCAQRTIVFRIVCVQGSIIHSQENLFVSVYICVHGTIYLCIHGYIVCAHM